MKTVPVSELEVPEAVISAVLNQDRVDEAPHSFYRYPARFSPVFAREAIKAFSRKGDTVLDNFCGGGTTLGEAIGLGRKAVGFDIRSLAVFLARTKTSAISVHDKAEILEWATDVAASKKPVALGQNEVAAEEVHYRRHLPDMTEAFFETVIDLAQNLPKARQQRLVR